ncbi:MAG: tetratricopeptide repeat protein, partial [Acidobacteria bacterium]|nr:tetratricopeptide repeat protein [Acidobacteriota bacterium]
AALENGGITSIGLQGLGGVGKTALALKLAEQLKERYPDAQFYLDLKGSGPLPIPVANALAHVIRAYYPTAKLPESEGELRGIYLSVLHHQRALLLMDNVKDEKQVEPLIPPASCMLLVTSRQHFTLPGLFARSLDSLPPADACRLLLTIAPRIGDQAGEIARLCGYLPLALRLAGGALAKYANLKPAVYARRLTGVRERLKLIEASLSLSYELLSTELQERWRALAVFPDTFDEAAGAAVWELGTEAAQESLGELLAFSLVEWNEPTALYRQHDLARLFADSRLSTDEREAVRQRHSAHYQSVLAAVKALYLKGGDEIIRGLELFDQEWTNIRAGQASAVARAGEDEAAARLCIDYPDSGASVLSLRQHPHEQIKWSESMRDAARRLKRRDVEGRAHGRLGIAYKNLGENRDAIEFFEQHLAIAREIGDRRGEGQALGSLGNAYENLGETRRAIEFFEQHLAIAREIGDRRNEGATVNNLGIAYYSLGETRRAIEFYEQALAIAHEIGYRRVENAALGNLGLAYADLDESKRAIDFLEQSLAIAREIGSRKGEGNALNNLGNAHAALGESRRAIDFYEQALIIAREIGDRRGEGHALWNSALALDNLGERTQAIASAEAALKIREQIEDPNAAKVRKKLEEWRGE